MTAPDPAAVQIVADAHAQHLRQLRASPDVAAHIAAERIENLRAELDAARARLAEIDEILSVEEGQTWANPALTPHFVRRLRAALGDAKATGE